MRKSVSVSFSGVDGAGKSTQIERLVADLSRDHRVEVLWNPLTFWPQSALSQLPRQFRRRLGEGRPALVERRSASTGTQVLERADVRVAGAFTTAFWLVVGSVAAVSSAFSLRRRLRASQADIVILDRFRLDTIVKLQYWYADVPARLLARIVLRLAPAPSLELLMRVRPEDAYARKAEQWSVEQLAWHARLYDGAAEAAGALVLDGREDLETLSLDIRRRVRALVDAQH